MKPPVIGFAISLFLVSSGGGASAIAQVTPDGTLSTSVTQNGNHFTITNGNQVGTNLFHSFSQFSVSTGGSAYFNNSATIQTIFARVTGGNVSNIDGLIHANGNASLFLLNPAGILFGPNASLNLGGSFVASTASSVVFADGTKFSAINPTSPPLLTMSVPIGLQMGSAPAPITIQGTGHAIASGGSTLAPFVENPSPTELRVQPGKTLALIGGNLNLTGATLNAPGGRIELGSLDGAGLVSLTAIAQGYQPGYENGQRFGDIQLNQRSLLTVGALPGAGSFDAGSVQLQGRQIQFSEGSLVLSTNLGNLPGGEISFQASEAIDITGTTADALISTGIRTAAFNSGTSSNVRINTPRLTLTQGAAINTTAASSARSGNIQINADVVEVTGFSPLNPVGGVTSLGTSSASTQPAGDLFVTSKSLLVSGGASVSSATFGAGATGQVTIRSTDTIVMGDNLAGLYSNISATTFGTGNAQTLTLDTTRLQLLNGGVIATTAWLIGEAGSININATESIFISGRSQSNNSGINSAAIRPGLLIQQVFGLPDILSADAGNVNVRTPNLIVTSGGTVSVTNQGTGNAGNIKISANTVFLDYQGSIQAQTASGEGGNIAIDAANLVLLRHNSLISATSGGAGNGGNITINAPIVTGFENSDIIANAFQGRGGNIQITTKGILGLQFRNQLTLENDITASSQFGVSGTVQVNTIGVDPNAGLVELPVEVADPSWQIATGCAGAGSSFVVTGRGGIPQNPTQQVIGDRTWNDMRDLSAYRQAGHPGVAQMPAASKRLVEATAWQQQPDGTVELIAAPSAMAPLPAFATCSGSTQTTLTQ